MRPLKTGGEELRARLGRGRLIFAHRIGLALSLLSGLGCSSLDTWRVAPDRGGLVLGDAIYSDGERGYGSGSSAWAPWNKARGDEYPLDGAPRAVSVSERVTCDQAAMVRYSGERLRYAGSLLVHAAFRERLARFEGVVADTAREVYGREPRRIQHYGAFSCRATRRRAEVRSEHALGNALDLVGFDFGGATKAAPLPAGMPRELSMPFQVRVSRHWASDKGVGVVHQRFLALLMARLQARTDVFRSMFGPGHGGHDDHVHLDMAPWRYVDL